MIALGPVAQFVKDGKPVRSATLHSTVAGATGREELLEFAAQLGLKPEWLKLKQSANEHFAVQNSRLDKAIELGATRMDRDALKSMVQRKREALGLDRVTRRHIIARSIVRDMNQRRAGVEQ